MSYNAYFEILRHRMNFHIISNIGLTVVNIFSASPCKSKVITRFASCWKMLRACIKIEQHSKHDSIMGDWAFHRL